MVNHVQDRRLPLYNVVPIEPQPPLQTGVGNMSQKLNRYSSRITEPKSQGASQAMLHGTGLTDADHLFEAAIGIGDIAQPKRDRHDLKRIIIKG